MEGSWSVVRRWKELSRCLKSLTASDLNIVYKKDGLMAISKPYGLPVHSGPRQGTCVLDLMDNFTEIHNLKKRPSLLHRLDKYACGVLLLSYDDDMTRKMAKLFEERKISKTYLGITVGLPRTANGVVVDRICEGVVGSQKRHRMVTAKDLQRGEAVTLLPDTELMKAYTAYSTLDSNRDTCSLVRYMTKTGYKHQVRLHTASSLNCPILGDHKFSSYDGGPQKLPLRLLQLLGIEGIQSSPSGKGHIRPWQRALIPLHLFAESVEIPEISTDGKPCVIKGHLPDFFINTLTCCKLDAKRTKLLPQRSQERKLRMFHSSKG